MFIYPKERDKNRRMYCKLKEMSKWDQQIYRKIKFNIIQNCFINNSSGKSSFVTSPLQRMSQDNDQSNATLTNRNQYHETQSSREQFQLPRLVPPQSRGRLVSRKQSKMPIHLPSINDDMLEDQNFRNTEMIHGSKSEHDMLRSSNQSSRDQFSLQIEDNLKIMMGQEENKTNQPFEEEDNLSDDPEFEQKILQNKEIIKMHRKKNQPPSDKKKSFEGLQRINDNNKQRFNKPQSNYQRKMKEYNLSLENKYLQRKKQSLGIIPEKPQKNQIQMQRAKSKKIITSLQDASVNNQAKANFGYKQFKNSAIAKSQAKESSRPLASINVNKSTKQQPSNSQRHEKQLTKQSNKTQQPLSPSKKINRTSALFDNIQTFLQNPTANQKHDKFYRQLFKKLKSNSIPKLQEQIKELNQKIGNNENYETKQTIGREQQNSHFLLTQNPLERTVRDWKRIDIKEKHKLKCKESDFDKELDYISYLQQKSSASLSRFIDQQKLMIELQMNRRFTKSISKEPPPDTKESNVSQNSGEEKS